MEDNKEVVGGVEFNKEKPVETPQETQPKQSQKKKTEIVGGVEFAKASEKKKKSAPKKDDGVHTMAEDMGDNANKKQGAVLQTILQEERARKEARKKQEKNLIFGLISSVLVLAAIGIFIYISRPEETVLPQVTVVQESLIYAENHSQIDTTNVPPISLISNINQALLAGGGRAGELTNTYLTRDLPSGSRQTLSARQFFSATQSSIPGDLIPILDNDFMLGTFAGNEPLPFLVIKAPITQSIEHMLAWESSLLQEMSRVLNIDITDPELFVTDFVDAQIQNKNMRALFDEDGEFVIGYAYLNESLIAIATNRLTFQELLQRLATNF